MKISLVMSVYNGEKFLMKQLYSIYNQTVSLHEVIIIDDCSHDNSVSIIKEFINDHKLHWKMYLNESNLGYKKSFRKGLEVCTGDVIFLCDQDDVWNEKKIEIMMKYLLKEEIKVLSSSFSFINQNDTCYHIKKEKGKSNNNLLFMDVKTELTRIPLKNLFRSNFSQGCCMAVKREIVNDYLGCFQNDIPHDWFLNILGAIKNGCYYLDIPLVYYRIHLNNTTGLNNILNKEENTAQRVKNRMEMLLEEKKIGEIIDNLNLDIHQKEVSQRNLYYLEKRLNLMKNKRKLLLIIHFMKGIYQEFGTFKTFVGDFLFIIGRKS